MPVSSVSNAPAGRADVAAQVDDFLFVTPNYDNAVAFLTLMLRGVPEYNCRVNPDKTLVNFATAADSPGGGGGTPVRRLADGALFPWCGLLIDTSTLAVVADYARYAGVRMSDTLTVERARNAGRAMRDRLVFSLRARCHRLFFDADVNPAAVQNVHRVLLLAAFKLHAYAARLPRWRPAFVVDVVLDVAGFVSSCAGGRGGGGGPLDAVAVQWLCLEAFRRKLGRHAGVYGAVLRAIARRQTALRRRLDDCRATELCRVVGDDLPADFQLILP